MGTRRAAVMPRRGTGTGQERAGTGGGYSGTFPDSKLPYGQRDEFFRFFLLSKLGTQEIRNGSFIYRDTTAIPHTAPDSRHTTNASRLRCLHVKVCVVRLKTGVSGRARRERGEQAVRRKGVNSCGKVVAWGCFWVHCCTMIAIHKTSDFKPRAHKIFDAAKTQPQYVVRDGLLFIIQRVDKIVTDKNRGMSAWDALARTEGLNVEIPKSSGKVRKVQL